MSRTAPAAPAFDTVVFDLGGVLVDWNPRYLYRKLFADHAEMEAFLANVCHGKWNEEQDAGRTFAEALAGATRAHPHYEAMIRAYFDRWGEMVADEIHGTSAILRELHAKRRHRLFALSNWSIETFPIARARFSFFDCFEAILLSGKERRIKPDPRFFALLAERHGVVPEKAVFIDDVAANTEAAERLGFAVVRFESPEQLREDLWRLGVL